MGIFEVSKQNNRRASGKTQVILTVFFSMVALLLSIGAYAQQTWRGLVIAPEHRCSPYNKKEQYPYSQSVEDAIVASMGGLVYGPYTGRYFNSDTETDIEHLLAASEAHDSGLCATSDQVRRAFASDLLNLTLAAPEVNRCQVGGKCGYDAGEWMPEKNKCWFASRVVQIKQKYQLTVDRQEAQSLEAVLSQCDSVDMIMHERGAVRDVVSESHASPGTPMDALQAYDDNGNGRITCAEARQHGIAPVRRGDAAYPFMNDRDGDGVVCN